MTARSRPPLETEVETRIRVALNAHGVLTWKHFVPLCWACGAKPNHTVGLGIGASDLVCVVPPHGRLLAIEVKRPGRRAGTSDAQDAWLAVVRKFGGVSGVATSEEEALELLEEARYA